MKMIEYCVDYFKGKINKISQLSAVRENENGCQKKKSSGAANLKTTNIETELMRKKTDTGDRLHE